MRKWIATILTMVLVVSLAACGGGNGGKNQIPDVFGIHYTDAIELLEAEGFEVRAIESGVDNFSDKLLYPLEKVDKGTVFKIDEYIIDSNGNLNKNYDVFYDDGLVSEDKSVVIYYAKEDYVLVKNRPSADSTPSTQPETEPATEATEGEKDSKSIDPEFKAAMDSYEKFFYEYVAFVKAYKASENPLSMMSEYTAMMQQYVDTMGKLQSVDQSQLSDEEVAYYAEVVLRINQKLLEAV